MTWDSSVASEIGGMFAEYTTREYDFEIALLERAVWLDARRAERPPPTRRPCSPERRARENERNRRYRAARANDAEWRAMRAAKARDRRAANDNKDQERAYRAAYREKNRERLREYKRAWNAKRYALPVGRAA